MTKSWSMDNHILPMAEITGQIKDHIVSLSRGWKNDITIGPHCKSDQSQVLESQFSKVKMFIIGSDEI